MTVTLTEADEKRILETLTIEACEELIEGLMDKVEQVKQDDPESYFVIGAMECRIEYCKLAIKFIEDHIEKRLETLFGNLAVNFALPSLGIYKVHEPLVRSAEVRQVDQVNDGRKGRKI